jgi:TonB-dependent starch-binding outer membrane protein SusC
MTQIRKLLAVLCAVAILPAALSAQERGSITGQVVDAATQQPLQGAQITVGGTTLGTITNTQGRFLIPNVPAGTREVRVSLIGYQAPAQSVAVTAGAATTVNFAMQPSAVELDALVVSAVTGRAERKRELGTNTATISMDEIERAPITRMADVLTGRTAGVQLQGVAGTIGTSQRIRIRGANSISLSNEPLIFVDGVQFSNTRGGFAVGGQDYSRLNDINPEDIQNIEILKGPAASAMYGTAAANGVILITTRRGRVGAPTWRAYAETGWSEDHNPYPTNFLPFQVNNASAPMFTARGNLNTAGGANAPYFFCPNFATGTVRNVAAGTCRQDQTLALNPFETPGLNPFTTGSRNKYGLSVGGGSEQVTYYLSGDFDTEQGVISFNTQDRVNLRANLGARITERLDANINAGYTRTGLIMNANDNNVFSPLINNLLATPHVPTQEQRDASPPGARFGTGFGHFLTDIAENVSDQTVDRFIVGGSTNFRPLPWLALNANLGMDFFGRHDQQTIQPGRLPIAATWNAGWRQSQRASNYIWTSNAAGVATHQLTNAIGTTTTVGTSFSREQFESTYCYGVGIVEGTRSCAATSSLFNVSEGYTEVRTIGAYLQQQFNFRDRVFLTGSIRGDDNSAFGQDFGFIVYPGLSASWVLSEEPFFPQINAVSNLRLRAAFGTSGQRPNVRDAVTLLDPVSATVNNQELSAVRLSRVGNPNLRPEKTDEFETGFDVGLLQDRLSVEFTYFNRQSRDALINRPLAPSFGLTGDATTTGTIFDNLGSVRNWGTELALNARVFQTPQAALNMRLSATTLDNRIEDLGEDIQPIVFNRGNQQHKQGFPTGAFFGRRYEIVGNPTGVLRQQDIRMVDDTTVFMGRMLPTNTQSLSGDLSLFRNLVTLSGLVDRRAGMQQLNYTELFRCQTGFNNGTQGAARGQCAAVADPNASIEAQAAFIGQRFGAPYTNAAGQTSNVLTSAGYIEDADFIKLRELSLTLGVPDNMAQRFQALRGASLTVSGRNLATWTNYTGLDPEINETGGGANFGQGEFNTQPPLRYTTVRLNFTF